METPPGLDPEKLLLRMSDGGTLSEEEVEEIVELFEAVEASEGARTLSVDDVYAWLVVLGRAKLSNLRHLIEKYLDVRDSLTVARVLETLCVDWNCTAEYLERVISFSLGVAWDEDQDVQQAAIKILGEYLRENLPKQNSGAKPEDDQAAAERKQRVLELLLSMAEDESLEQWTRQSAYYSLCRADGKEWEEIPSECVMLDFSKGSKDLDREMLGRLRAALARLPHEDPPPPKARRADFSVSQSD